MKDFQKQEINQFDCLKKAIRMVERLESDTTGEYWDKVIAQAEKIFDIRVKIMKEVH